jgi:hypothetical protein
MGPAVDRGGGNRSLRQNHLLTHLSAGRFATTAQREAISGRKNFNSMNLLIFFVQFSLQSPFAGLAGGSPERFQQRTVHRLIHKPGTYGRG